MKEDPKLKGLCKECTHRNSCEDAKRYLNMIGCGRYKHWKKKKITGLKKSRWCMDKKEIIETLYNLGFNYDQIDYIEELVKAIIAEHSSHKTK